MYDLACEDIIDYIKADDKGFFVRIPNKILKVDLRERDSKDWLTYLTHDMKLKHPKHKNIIEEIYSAVPSKQNVAQRITRLRELRNWMKGYCEKKKWL